MLDPEENDGLANGALDIGNNPDNADGVLQPGLIDLLTVRGDGKINLNTAPRSVLATLPISDDAVDQMVGFRAFDRNSRGSLDDHVFRSAEDIQTLNGLTDTDRDVLVSLSRFTSDYYRIHVQSWHRPTGLRHHLEVLVHVSDAEPGVLAWSHP